MNTSSGFAQLMSVMWAAPYLIVYPVGILLALVFWPRHPKVSLLAFLGFGILLLNILFALAANFWLTSGAGGGSSGNVVLFMQVTGIVRGCVAAFGYALLMAAIFSGRQKNEAPVNWDKSPGAPPFR